MLVAQPGQVTKVNAQGTGRLVVLTVQANRPFQLTQGDAGSPEDVVVRGHGGDENTIDDLCQRARSDVR